MELITTATSTADKSTPSGIGSAVDIAGAVHTCGTITTIGLAVLAVLFLGYGITKTVRHQMDPDPEAAEGARRAITMGLAAAGAATVGVGARFLLGAASGSSTDHPATVKHTSSRTASSSSHAATADPPWAWIGFVAVAVVLLAVVAVLLMIARARVIRARDIARQRSALQQRWDTAEETLQSGTRRWLVYDEDLAALLRAPAMRDYTYAPTNLAARAMTIAEHVAATGRPDRHADLDNASEQVERFEKVVHEFDRALTQAIRCASSAGLAAMSSKERRTLQQAQDALRLAEHGATEAERRNAYRLVQRLMRELDIDLPQPARDVLETKVRQQLTAPSGGTVSLTKAAVTP